MDKQHHCYYLVFLTGLLSYSVEASDWPEGSYGLPMAKTGCPAGATFKWETGWIYQDTEDDNPQSSKSNSFHIEGQVKSSSVNRSFCIKTDTSGDYYSPRPYWPSGTYCIYQKTRNCPTSFAGGSVKWDDEDHNNGNVHQGTVPRSTQIKGHDFTTEIFFCCRDDGPKATAIDLPTASPFYLLAHLSEKCQQVRWAVAIPEWIYYDTEDDDCYDSGHITHNHAPYIYKKETSLKLYYCYYTSCQYSLNTSTGSIESPGFPANYSNGQQCSWKISAKANQTIFVRFVNFSLADMDSLMFHDGPSAASPDIVALDGASTSSEIASGVQSSSSNLFVVFHSNEGGSSSGFKAMYSTTGSEVTAHTITSSTTAKVGSTTRSEETTTAEEITTQQSTRITSRTTTKETEKINPAETTPSSSTPSSKSSTEPSSPLKGNSSKNYDTFKKTFVQQNQSALIAVAIVIPLICMIAVIAMAAYLFRRLRNLREKPSNVSVRYTTDTTSGPESMNNPSYVPTDAVIETRSPGSNDANDVHEDSNGDIYQEVEPNRERQTTDNPLYQSTDDDKHVYASFA